MIITKAQRFFMLAGEYRYRTRMAFRKLRGIRSGVDHGDILLAQDAAADAYWRYRAYMRDAVRIAQEEKAKVEEVAYHKGHGKGFDAGFASLMF